jgi:hypothetical protein
MAFFGLFGSKDEGSQLKRHAERVANRRIQSVDRWDAIHALCRLQTPEAVAALLRRFTFYVDPSISDQEEKDAAFEGIVAAGQPAIEPVVEFLQRAESLSWPLKMLARLTSEAEIVRYLLELLASMGTDYERDPQRKVQVLAALEERRDPRIASTVERFLQDANETVRFHAVTAILAQENRGDLQAELLATCLREESVRIRVRILEGFAAGAWSVGDASDALRGKLPSGFRLDAKGVPTRS